MQPKPLHLNRNLCRLDDVPAASFASWELVLDGRQECGTAVEVAALAFDESDARQIRKLATWLLSAADWLDARRAAKRRRRCGS
jgi:hypothetical protein